MESTFYILLFIITFILYMFSILYKEDNDIKIIITLQSFILSASISFLGFDVEYFSETTSTFTSRVELPIILISLMFVVTNTIYLFALLLERFRNPMRK